MYADDTTLYCCLEGIDYVNKQAVINQELQKINNWRIAKGLKLNTNNSKYMTVLLVFMYCFICLIIVLW